LIGRALSAERQIPAVLYFFECKSLSTAETELEMVLKLPSIILFIAVVTKLHPVLQLKVRIGSEFEATVDAIIGKKGFHF
jgi:hypothetical protein